MLLVANYEKELLHRTRMTSMNKYVWFNHYLPQTLQISVAIAYFRGVMLVLFTLFGGISIIELGLTALMVAGAFGIANLKRWGYWLSLVSASIPFVFIFLTIGFSIGDLLSLILSPAIVGIVIQVAILALLIHPMSRDFVKKNFTN